MGLTELSPRGKNSYPQGEHTMSTAIWSSSKTVPCEVGEPRWNPNVYRCHLAIIKDDDDSFSVIVLNLPGTGSCGRTEDEAIENVREAVSGVIAVYLEDNGGDIPWQTLDSYTIPEGAKQKWILVDA